MCFCQWYGDPQDLHVRTRSFPTRLSSDLAPSGRDGPARSDRPLGEFQGVVADVVAPYLLAQIVLGQQALIQAFTHEAEEERLLARVGVPSVEAACRFAVQQRIDGVEQIGRASCRERVCQSV